MTQMQRCHGLQKKKTESRWIWPQWVLRHLHRATFRTPGNSLHSIHVRVQSVLYGSTTSTCACLCSVAQTPKHLGYSHGFELRYDQESFSSTKRPDRPRGPPKTPRPVQRPNQNTQTGPKVQPKRPDRLRGPPKTPRPAQRTTQNAQTGTEAHPKRPDGPRVPTKTPRLAQRSNQNAQTGSEFQPKRSDRPRGPPKTPRPAQTHPKCPDRPRHTQNTQTGPSAHPNSCSMGMGLLTGQ